MKNWKAIFFENSRISKVLSVISPIEITAITLGPFVFCNGKASDAIRNHENIHWQQYLELGIIGFVFLYFFYYFVGLLKYGNGQLAYFMIPFEQEAYSNHENLDYLKTRIRYSWLKYKV